MRIIIALLFSAGLLCAADDITVSTTTTTNAQSGAVTTIDNFKRAGQRIMLRSTTITNGVVWHQVYRFYHDGKLAADHLSNSDTGYLLVETHNGYHASIEHFRNIVSRVLILDEGENVVDRFDGTNGMLVPMPTSELRKYMSKPQAAKVDEK